MMDSCDVNNEYENANLIGVLRMGFYFIARIIIWALSVQKRSYNTACLDF